MKNSLIIAIIALVVGGGILFLVLWRLTSSPTTTTTPTTNTGSTQTPSGGTTGVTVPVTGASTSTGGTNTTQGGTIPVATSNDSTMTVRDFRSDSDVATSPDYPGQYILAGGLDPSGTGAPYSTFYLDSDQSFTVTLLQEPIKDIRRLAEQDLMQQLGINQNQACGLRYQVLVPYAVNSIYSSKNLGFSFCPGATAL